MTNKVIVRVIRASSGVAAVSSAGLFDRSRVFDNTARIFMQGKKVLIEAALRFGWSRHLVQKLLRCEAGFSRENGEARER
jgi:hypothetical protein